MTVYIRADRDDRLEARFGKCGRTHIVHIRRSVAERILGEPVPQKYTALRIRRHKQGRLHLVPMWYGDMRALDVSYRGSEDFLCQELAEKVGLGPGRFSVTLVPNEKGKR